MTVIPETHRVYHFERITVARMTWLIVTGYLTLGKQDRATRTPLNTLGKQDRATRTPLNTLGKQDRATRTPLNTLGNVTNNHGYVPFEVILTR
jgi:hypothetical protein